MLDRGGEAAYAELVATAEATIRRSGAQRAAADFGIDELLDEADGDRETDQAVPAFLEAQGYHAGVSSVLARYALVDLVRAGHPELVGAVLGEPRYTGAVASVPGWTAGRAVAVDSPGNGLLLSTTASARVEVHPDPAPDDYVVMVEPHLDAAAAVVPETELAPRRPCVTGRLRLGASAETLGACSRLLEDASVYVRQRQQFGETLSTFQSVREMLAWAATERHQLRVLLDAALLIPEGTDEWVQTAMVTKALAGRVGRRVAQLTLQATGGIAFTWEYSHHRLARRTLVLDAVGGSSADLTAQLGRAVRETGDLPDFVRL